jgi:putative sulfotransferase
VAGLSPAPIGEQYQRVFAWLARRHGRTRWVERSGGSLRIVRRLHAAFPDARFVHLVRDGRNCALSMSRHLGFRMALVAMQQTEILGVDPWESPDRTHENDLPDELVPLLPEHFDRAAFLAYDTPLPLCGHYWAGEIMEGLRELAELAPSHLLTVRYEDFGQAPRAAIARLFEFLGVETDAAWLDTMTARIRPARSDWSMLPPRERRALDDACQPGFAALGSLYEGIA